MRSVRRCGRLIVWGCGFLWMGIVLFGLWRRVVIFIMNCVIWMVSCIILLLRVSFFVDVFSLLMRI